jgi:hypothetical protein
MHKFSNQPIVWSAYQGAWRDSGAGAFLMLVFIGDPHSYGKHRNTMDYILYLLTHDRYIGLSNVNVVMATLRFVSKKTLSKTIAIPVSWKFWSSMSFLKLHPESCDGDHQWLIFCSGGETTAFASRHLSGFIEQTRRCFWAWIRYSVNGCEWYFDDQPRL